MEEECARKRAWLSLSEFNERYVFVKLLPGPIATQMAIWMGYHVRGRIGGLVSFVAFMMPCFLLMLVLSVFYARVSHLEKFTPIIQGMEAGSIVVIFQSVLSMFKPYYKRIRPWIFLLVSAPLMLVIPHWEPLIILMGGMLVVFARRVRPSFRLRLASPTLLWSVFWIHFKAGFTVFGTGLAIVPVLQHEVVEIYNWMTTPEFLDGIAFGQITPGPVTISSIFTGYKIAGILGATTAFLGMYSPGMILIFFVVPPLFHVLKGRPFVADFQQGAIPTVIGCISGATLLLGKATVTTPFLGGLVILLGGIALWVKLPGWATILLGSAAGFLYSSVV